jgi:hypothetical protein
MRGISAAGATTLVFSLASGALAQEWKQVPSSYTNTKGFVVTGFTVQSIGSGCQGSQQYVKVGDPNNRGVSRSSWSSVSKQDGGTVCSSGTWYYGGGPRVGQAGGKADDVLIKNGKFYKRSLDIAN